MSTNAAGRNPNMQGKPIRANGLVMVSTGHHHGNHHFKPYSLVQIANRPIKVVAVSSAVPRPVSSAVPTDILKLTAPLPPAPPSWATVAPSIVEPPTSVANSLPLASLPVEADKRKRIFSKELRCMMYGFGDDLNPYTESVDMIEDLVLQFISDIAIRALNFGANDRISIEDLMYILRKDTKKYSRLKELLDMNLELRQARRAFDEIKFIEP